MLRFNRFYNQLQLLFPEFNYKFKTQSTLMRLISYLLFFNRSFMDNFTTTIGYTVYFTSQEHLEINGDAAGMTTLAHEFVHATDAKNISRPLFYYLYLLPGLLAPLTLFFGFYSWILAIVLFLVFLAPLPAPFRAYFELKGYTMSLFMLFLFLNERNMSPDDIRQIMTEKVESINKQFTTFNYYLMWPFGVKDILNQKMKDILSGDIYFESDLYTKIKKAFIASK